MSRNTRNLKPKAQSASRIGILGGTFNPIHLGHLLIAQDALEQAKLDRVKFVPCAAPPHKRAPQLAPAAHRLRMIELAIAGDARFEVDDLEIRRGGERSYSLHTLIALRAQQPNAKFFFIIGADSYRELHRWYRIEQLANLCEFLVAARPGFALKNPRLPRAVKAHRLATRLCEISSTEIRARLARDKSIRYQVPDAVCEYIARHKLYCERRSVR